MSLTTGMRAQLLLVTWCFAATVLPAPVRSEDPEGNSPSTAQASDKQDSKGGVPPETEQAQPGQAASPKQADAADRDDAKVKKKPTVKQSSVKGLKAVASRQGVKYWDIKTGDGESPDPNATVVLHYSTWLGDGTLMHTTRERNQPERLEIKWLPPSLADNLLTMKVGGTRRIEIPGGTPYAAIRRPPGVPPGADLIYEVELVAVSRTREPPSQTSVAGIDPVTTASGLKYWDIKVGKGESPKPDAIVTVQYSGWLAGNGKLFQSTIQNGRAESFRLDKVIKGLGEGIESMRVGGKRRLEVPPELGYGAEGMNRFVPPNARLVFEVELLAVQDPLPRPKQSSVEGIEPVVVPSGVKYWDMKIGPGKSP
ncbi:MAG: FKBP-type peptidyl-prolyl cis-trans isomerase, partial [Phycisphaerae bacterium]